MEQIKKNIRLVALDMDGTLFNNKLEITPKTQETIRAAVAAGVHIVISTGRPYIGLPVDSLTELGIRYAITANGSAIYRLPEKECIFSNCMRSETVAPIIRYLQTKDIQYDAFIGGNRYSEEHGQNIIDRLTQMPAATRSYIKTSGILTDNLADFILERELEIQKMTLNFYPLSDGSYKDRSEVWKYLKTNPQVTVLSGGYQNVEFTKAGTTKAMGLRFLADMFHITIKETMAVGDSQNDMDILQAAGIGIAMENAADEVKKIADFVTRSNLKDGVAYAIEKFVL